MKYPGINDKNTEASLDKYAGLLHKYNNRFNLTGLKTVEEIQEVLIAGSIFPFRAINVPRGTLMADIGTGAGIPGIPLSIIMQKASITMFDSTLKKIEFIKEAIKKLGIENASAVCGRIEELGRDSAFRECFDWVTTRAMADPFTAVELGAPLLKTGGYMYLYASEKQSKLTGKITTHLSRLGLEELKEQKKLSVLETECSGILLVKTGSTDLKFPRRMAAIKRNS